MKKILHIIERFNVAGAEVVVKDLLIALSASSKFELQVCVLHDIGVLGAELKKKGFSIHFLNWSKDKLSDRQICKKIKKIVLEQNIDLVHVHNITPWYFSQRAFFFNSRKPKLCVTIHGFITGKGGWKKKILYVLLSHFTNKLIIVSNAIIRDLEKIPLMKTKHCDTILNGVDLPAQINKVSECSFRETLGLKPDDFVVGTVGRLYREKNLELQIMMIERLKKIIPNIKLVIVAEKYRYIEVLKKLTANLNVEKNVIFAGLRRDIPHVLNSFDIFVMTSLSEGTSLALLEALSSGVPVVVSRVGGNPDIVQHKKNGLLFDVNDLDEFCSQILLLYEDADFRDQICKNAKKSRAQFSIANMSQKYETIYNQMLN